ncbi:unnamed protein product [Owenia fusiformis]|uniref:RanBP2-type domain-containing protein n=1 Tax=Owenia fusiformis TaxID=6347 RepID=A0A8S4NN85_OWEFU|nr:unnamed protein product [Owenia fusiformis]
MLGLPSSTFALKLKISVFIIIIMAAASCLTFMWFIHANNTSKAKYRYTSEYEIMNIDPTVAEMIRKAKLFSNEADFDHRIDNNPDPKAHMYDYWEAKRIKYNITGYNIAIGCAITTRGSNIDEYNINSMPFFQYLFKSFCRTASGGFSYHFYIAHDHDDPFFSQKHSHRRFEKEFYRITAEQKQIEVEWTVHLHYVDCDHSRKPAWAQNDAMTAAYFDNMDYFYRVNDDSMFQSPVWVEAMIEELLKRNPTNVGVVGPSVMGGNQYIFTHDFVHRTHIDIFGFYYPRRFTDWWADDWISNVYPHEYRKRMYDVRVRHFLADSRYKVSYANEQYVQEETRTNAEWFDEWLHYKHALAEVDRTHTLSNKVIAFSLYGSEKTFTYGAIRNAVLAQMMLPGWKVRIYTGSCSYKYTVPNKILNKLKQLGAIIHNVDDDVCNNIAPGMWRYLVADENETDYFIVRDSNARLSAREVHVVSEWTSKGSLCHCIRDHKTPRIEPIVSGLFGGRPAMIRAVLKVTMKKLLLWNTSREIILKKLWKVLKPRCLCHDSVSCDTWPNSKPFEHAVRKGKYIGKHFTEFGQPIEGDFSKKIVQRNPNFKCTTETNNELGQTINKLKRMTMWSMDYNIAHIYAIKYLFEAYGITTIDKSLSPGCAITHTCATGMKVRTDYYSGLNLNPYLIQQFYNAYRNDPQMKNVDFFLCVSPISMCRLYEKFSKPMLLLATNRYEFGSDDFYRWKELDMYLELYSSQPQNVIAASNLYDLNYIKYYTGIQPVLVPLTCNYVNERYNPSKETIILAQIPNSDFRSKLMTDISNTQSQFIKSDFNFRYVGDEYSDFEVSDLAKHPAVIMVPKQVSTILFCEVYQIGIPVFIPTVELLTSWHVNYNVVSGKSLGGSINAPLPSGVNASAPDPNRLEEYDVKHWLGFSTTLHVSGDLSEMEERRSAGRAKRQAKSVDDGYWDCSVCTFKNSPEAFKCDMCDVRKGTSTRKPKLNATVVAQQVSQQYVPPPIPKKEKKKERLNSGKKRLPRLKNIDRSSPQRMAVTVENVTVIIKEYKLKPRRISAEASSSNTNASSTSTSFNLDMSSNTSATSPTSSTSYARDSDSDATEIDPQEDLENR